MRNAVNKMLRLRMPAVRNAMLYSICSAINVRNGAPIAIPAKSPAIMKPLILPCSCFFVVSMAHASVDTSRNPMPH